MFLEKILSILFPKVCGICKNKINEKYTCENCSNILKYTMERELCVRNLNFYVDKLISLFVYKDFIRDKILEFKFDGKAYVSNTFADIMCKAIIDNKVNVDVIVPVPIHRKRYMQRGYNQSELLSRYIAKKLKLKHEAKALIKEKNNLAQSALNYASRRQNVLNVYKVHSNKNIKGRRVLLIDDIYTTGATANECARLLKENGAMYVICMTIAHVEEEK